MYARLLYEIELTICLSDILSHPAWTAMGCRRCKHIARRRAEPKQVRRPRTLPRQQHIAPPPTARSAGMDVAMSAADERTVHMALEHLERSTGRRCRRCGNAIAENAGKPGAAWSVCSVCAPAIAAEARQLEIEPPLVRRCLVCRTLLGDRRRGVRTCGTACRTVLSRILRRQRPRTTAAEANA